jgi:hypothetical protein
MAIYTAPSIGIIVLLISNILVSQGCKPEVPYSCSDSQDCPPPGHCSPDNVCILENSCDKNSDCLTGICLQSQCKTHGNLITTNEGFESDYKNWWQETYDEDAAIFTIDDNTPYSGKKSAKIEISKQQTKDSYVQLSQLNIPIIKDKNYLLRFKAKADRQMYVRIEMHKHTSDWHTQGIWYNQNVTLTTDWQTEERIFTATETESVNTRLAFMLAYTPGTIWIDEVEFYELPES